MGWWGGGLVGWWVGGVDRWMGWIGGLVWPGGWVDWWSGGLQLGVRRFGKSLLARATAMGRRIFIVVFILIRNFISILHS